MAKEKKPKKSRNVSKISGIGLGKQKDYFIENLTMLISAGMDLSRGLVSLQDEMKAKPMKKMIGVMAEDINAGLPLWRALKSVNMLPPHMLYLVRIGEETGRLPQNLEVIVKQREKEKNFRSKIRSAMMYPVMVLSLTLVVGTGIAWFVLPKLTNVFDQLNLELPLITRIIIKISDFLNEYGFIAVPIGFTVLGVLLYFVFLYHKTKFIGQAILFRVPVIKSLLQNVELARFGFVLGTLLDAGLPITQAIGSLRESTTFKGYQKFFEILKVDVQSGNSFQKTMKEYKRSEKLIPIHIQHMIVAGEQSGTLPKTLKRIGERYELKVEDTTKNLSVLIEPFLLVIVWLGVMLVALAVILPIYSLIGNLGDVA